MMAYQMPELLLVGSAKHLVLGSEFKEDRIDLYKDGPFYQVNDNSHPEDTW